MDQSGMEIPVTLIIKAPNQKYRDQTISCFLNWTVGKLKAHLSNVYPSKPVSVDELSQRLGPAAFHAPAPRPHRLLAHPRPSWGRQTSFGRRRSILGSEVVCVCMCLEWPSH